ncbi:MAG: glutamate synthase central domain-containing protein [Sandaracinaceae bacterium]
MHRPPPTTPGARGLYDPSFEHDACGVGFVADIRGRRSHQIVLDGDTVLRRMEHRGACGAEVNTGDGAGILTALPHELLERRARDDLGLTLPEPGRFAAGNVFLPRSAKERAHCKRTFERIVREQGLAAVGWREVPTDPDGADIGPSARASMPAIEQLFVVAPAGLDAATFERQLYVIRKRAGTALRRDARLREAKKVYVCSLSTRVIVYKGMLTPTQLMPFYPDLADWDYRSHLAMVHSRFSTNTFPSWERAQPLRTMSHNGEINTLRGNVAAMHDREGLLESDLFGEDLKKCFPIAEPTSSDSGKFDNVLELLLMAGRSLPEAVMMMVPEAWQKDRAMSPEKRAFYEYHSCLMEPWDGPASIAFTDGRYIGAVLDRNGLRPSRYVVTKDDRVVMASEVGVLPMEAQSVKAKGRLQPGKMFLVDFQAGRLIPDEEVKHLVAARRPYRRWLDENRLTLRELLQAARGAGNGASNGSVSRASPVPETFPAPAERESVVVPPPPAPTLRGAVAPRTALAEVTTPPPVEAFDPATLIPRLQAFGYTTETLQFMLLPMVRQKRDPLGSMGNDSALACLSDQPRLVYDYFKQLFAQVTNPPIDSIREEVIMSLQCYCGPEGNLLRPGPRNAARLLLPHPILNNEELAALRDTDYRGWRSKVIDITWARVRGAAGLDFTLHRIAQEAEAAVDDGYAVLVLSDRQTSGERVPVSALLATGAVHTHLVSVSKRARVGLLVETGEAREVHHHSCLVGFGADAINPYLAFEALWQARRDGLIDLGAQEALPADESGEGDEHPASGRELGQTFGDPITADDHRLVTKYRTGVAKGMLKVMAKMGISTLQSYKGAQIFVALGLRDEVIDRCFTGTASRVQGVGFQAIAE